ncbi:hypothetical protein KCU93_g5893, partial [Aureobasidium melanogenum]
MSQPDHSGDINHLMSSAMGHLEKQVCLQPGLAKTTSTMNSGTYEKYVRPPSPVMFSSRRDTSFSEAIKKPLPPPVLPQQDQSTPSSKPGSSSRKNLTQTNTRQTSADNAARRQYSSPQITPGDVLSPTRPKELQLQRPPPEFDSFKKHMKPPTTKAEKEEAGLSWPIQLYQSPDPSVPEADRVALPRLGSAIRKSFSNRDGWIGSPPAYLEDLYGRPAVIRYFAVLRDSKMERKLSPTSDITKQQVKEKAGEVQSPQISAPTTRTKTLPKKSLPISNTKSPQEWSKDMVEARKGEPVIDNPDDVFRTPTDVAEFNATRDKYYPGMEDITYRALKGCPLKPLEHMGDAEAQHWLVVQAILRVKPKLPGTYK